jgi:hypothetical protein
MSKTNMSPKTLSRLGLWGIPLLSIGFIVPLILSKSLFQDNSAITAPKDYGFEQKIETAASQPQPNLSLEDNGAGLAPQSAGLKSPTVYQRKKPTVDKQELAQLLEEEQGGEFSNPPQSQAPSPLPQKSVAQSVNNQVQQAQTPESPVYNPPVTPVNYKPPAIEIKVMLANGASSLTVSTSNTGAIADSQGKILKNISANEGLTVTANGNSLNIGGEQLPSVVWLTPNIDGLVYIGDRWYRGRLLLVSQGTGVLAVNYVDLEQYLYSVVGTEMHPTAPSEALKAQAIAARSYALVHIIRPASSWYHLGATQRWQAYKGIDKEYNTSQKAVNDTAGQILSYKGGIVESLYAATDEIVARAHGGRGMSQIGAYKLADQGYDYLQILGNYYPGVGVARIVTQQ